MQDKLYAVVISVISSNNNVSLNVKLPVSCLKVFSLETGKKLNRVMIVH